MNPAHTREEIYTALTTLLQTVTGIKTVTRRLKHWQDLAPEETPALYIEQTGESWSGNKTRPNPFRLEANLHLYINSQGEAVGPIVNPILDRITALFDEQATPGNVVTLGGKVHRCWIEGMIQIFEGDLGDDAVVVIPLKLLVS